MSKAGMSRRVRATHDRLNLWSEGWIAPEKGAVVHLVPPRGRVGPSDHAEKPNDFNAGPLGPVGLVGSGDGVMSSAPDGGAPGIGMAFLSHLKFTGSRTYP